MIIGLTGGIASGKTAASEILKEIGAVIVDADVIAHKITEPGEEGYKKIVEEFGEEILKQGGGIDRKHLAKLIFNNSREKSRLEDITHPIIINRIKSIIERYQNKENFQRPLIIVAPLLYETGMDDLVEEVWLIYVDRETQIERLKNRDGISKKQALNRIESQMPLSVKKKKGGQSNSK